MDPDVVLSPRPDPSVYGADHVLRLDSARRIVGAQRGKIETASHFIPDHEPSGRAKSCSLLQNVVANARLSPHPATDEREAKDRNRTSSPRRRSHRKPSTIRY